MTRKIHLPTLVALTIVYSFCVFAIAVIPHNFEEPGSKIGKMEAHQLFTMSGRIATLGLIDCTLVDWYMLGPTKEDNIRPYNRVVAHSILILTPVFSVWIVLLSAGMAAILNRKGIKRQKP